MDDFESMSGMKRPYDDDGGQGDDDDNSENEHQTSKSRGTVTVQIFIKKTFKMINDCDPKIACWTPEGDKFIIKDPDQFAQLVIPQYFDHNKFSSFTRQLNFYKFTREQSKAIKKSDNSSEIAKHQTFYHKYFQKGRPELLKHLQRSRKANGNDDDMHPHHQREKKPKLVTSEGSPPIHEKSVVEQITDLARRVTESELTIKNLQQDNAALSFAVQKLQKQDELKQRALVALQEQMRMSEVTLSQSLQQQQSQLLQFTQPLPFSREPSLSGVNASTLMRFLSIDPKLQMSVDSKLQRLTTPPFGNLTAASQGASFSAAAAAENLVQQAENAAAAARANHSAALGGGGATLPRHSKFKSSAESTAAAVAAASMDNGSSLSASLQRHANFKSSGDSPGQNGGASSMGNGASLPRHPRMRGRGGASASLLSHNGFMDNTKTTGLGEALRNSLDGKAGGNEKNETLSSMQQQILANNNSGGTGGISPSPGSLVQNGFAHLSGSLGASLHNNMTAATLRAAMQQESNMQAALRLGAAGLQLERELSNIGGDNVSREESFTLASLLDLSRSSTQQI